MKGNYQARVHLIGFNHIRAHGRALNKYLDYICKEIEQHKKDLEEKSNIEKRN